MLLRDLPHPPHLTDLAKVEQNWIVVELAVVELAVVELAVVAVVVVVVEID